MAEAQASGELSTERDPGSVATLLLAVAYGFQILSKCEVGQERIEDACAALLDVLFRARPQLKR